jgi:hypothetical protein
MGNHTVASGSHLIAELPNYDRAPEHADRKRDEANARLIAAAPAMLEALEHLVRFAEELCTDVNVSSHYPSVDGARAAIRAAKWGG